MPSFRTARRPALAAAAALLVLPLAGCGLLGPDPGPAPLAVQDNLLVLDGERAVLAGASVYVMPFYDDGEGGPDASLAETTQRVYEDREQVFTRMREAGADTVRVPVGLTGYEDDVYGLGGKEGYLERLRQVVEAAAEQDLRVVVGWWDSHSDGRDWLQTYRDVLPMMRDVREALEPFPGVVYEPFNEPHDVSWEEWEPVMADVVRFWREDLGHEGVLVIDTIDYSWSFEPEAARRLQELDAGLRADGEPALVFANHRYANHQDCFCGEELAEWEEEVGQHVDEFPLLGTEYGRWTGPDFTPQPQWNEQFTEHLTETAVPAGFNGYLAFVWDWVDENSMTQDEGRELNAWGELVRETVLERYGQ